MRQFFSSQLIVIPLPLSPDFEPTVIIPAALASVVAYCTFGLAFPNVQND